jgi:alcohol dehydrogenase class IV
MTHLRTTWSFRAPAQLTFGTGAAQQVGTWLARAQCRQVLLISDRQLTAAGITPKIDAALRAADVQVGLFEDGQAEPSLDIAQQAIEFARTMRPAAVIGLGGGSNMDLAKVTATVLAHGGRPQDYFGFDRVPGPILPLVCIPTTAGTGSEVSHAAVLTDTAQHVKVSTLSHHLRPRLALVDPDLVAGCPRRVMADAGMDALTHAIEAYTAVDFDRLDVPASEEFPYEGRHPLGDCLAEKAIVLIRQHLASAVDDPHNREAREGMCLAATLAGLAFSNCGVALVHALEYPLGGALHCTHGAGNALLLPHVMRFNLPQRQSALARVAALLGAATESTPEATAAEIAVEAVSALGARVGIPRRIRDLGGTREQLPAFAEKTFAIKRLLKVNPRQASCEDLLGILEAAY